MLFAPFPPIQVLVVRPPLRALVQSLAEPASRSEQGIVGYQDALALIHESGAEAGQNVDVLCKVSDQMAPEFLSVLERPRTTFQRVIDDCLHPP